MQRKKRNALMVALSTALVYFAVFSIVSYATTSDWKMPSAAIGASVFFVIYLTLQSYINSRETEAGWPEAKAGA
ncbi:MAG: hypothetical protein V1911_02530 [Candidatus Micrarchaeota archaeon]